MAPPVHPRLLAVIGDPVEHSLSPPMQNAAFQAAGLPFVYIAVRAAAGRLGEAVQALQLLGARGANVTVPHKEAAARLAHWLGPEARASGTVNTLVFDGGRILGHSTDGAGFCRALTDVARVDPAGRRVLLVGAGGAARAVGVALVQRGASVVAVVNRTPDRARIVAGILAAAGGGTPVEARPWPPSSAGWAELFRRVDLVVHATSAGLTGTGAELWEKLPFHALPDRALVADLVYTPRETAFLQAAARAGRPVLPGDWMLLYQGAEAFRIWTGAEAPLAVMRAVLDDALGQAEEGRGPSQPRSRPGKDAHRACRS